MCSRYDAAGVGYFYKVPFSVAALVIAEGFVFGLTCSGPAVFALQWARGRRAPLMTGELLWLWAAALRLVSVALGDMALWLGGPLLLSLLALAVPLSELAEPKRPVAWTETVGCMTCFFALAAPVFVLIVHAAAPP